MIELITGLLHATLKSATPLFYSALGEIYSEKSGVLNLGLEGLLLVGALSGYAVAYKTGSLAMAVLFAILFSAALSLLFAFFVVTLRANQIVAGIALTIIGTGITSYFGKNFIGIPAHTYFKPIAVPYLSKIPIIGTAIFNQDLLVYTLFPILLISNYIINHTRFGLHLKMCGENPLALESSGGNVLLTRYIALVINGAFNGLAGVYLSLAYTPMWIENMSSGRGWIAIAIVIFSGWRPNYALVGALIFGFANALQLRLQALGIPISPFILLMLPYIFTILALIFGVGISKTRVMLGPAALTKPFFVEERD